jgi:hypothetical protein
MSMNSIDAWQWLLTFVGPFVLAVVNKPGMSATLKRWIMVGYAVVAGVGSEIVKDLVNNGHITLTWDTLLPRIVVIVGAVTVWYNTLKQVPVSRQALNKIEVATAKDTSPQTAVALESKANAAAEAEFRKDVAA